MSEKTPLTNDDFAKYIDGIVDNLGTCIGMGYWQAAGQICRIVDSLIANHAPRRGAAVSARGQKYVQDSQAQAQTLLAAAGVEQLDPPQS